ncbi:MAG: VWA domain-containing protein [Sedimentisphaerales bacterium]|nr:VWA domain-containing protein [Sedimentisphaerales bacterium]
MRFLTPWTALGAAAVAVPLLLLLYFLKLKRREQIVSSTLLWQRAVQDLQVNAPFQRLRKNILLFLQLLMLAALLFGLAGPILSLTGGGARRHVILIDRSASMSATDVKPSRLAEAKRQARIYVESLRSEAFFRLRGDRDETMLIAFDSRAKVMCNFTSDKQQLFSAIDRIEGGDGGSALGEAIMVAQAFSLAPDDQPANESSQERAKLILFSDGRIRDADRLMVDAANLTFHCIGESGENIGVTAMQARRSYENPDDVEVFSTVANYGPEPVTTDVQLSVNESVRAVKSVSIPAGGWDRGEPGKVAVHFSLSSQDSGVLAVSQMRRDVLASDDTAWSILEPAKKLNVLLVTEGNTVLELALKACPLAGLDIMTPSEFDANSVSNFSLQDLYDVIVLDGCQPARMPRSRYMVFGRPPKNIDVSVIGELQGQVVVDWRPKHAVLKYVSLTNLFAQKCYGLDLPRDAEILAEFNESPALTLVRRDGSVFLLAPFDILNSNWPFEPSFVLFCYNAVSFLGMQVGQNQEANLLVGEPISIDGLGADQSVLVDGPVFSGREIKASPNGSVRFPATDRAGIYGVRSEGTDSRLFAVNLLDSSESNIAPRRALVFSGQEVTAEEGAFSLANVPLWPVLVGIVLFLACLEWFVYSRKMRI